MPTRPGQAATADPGCSGPGRAPQAQTARWPQTFLPVQCLLRTPQPTVHVTAFLPTARPAPPGPAGMTVSWYEKKSSGTQQHKVTGMADSMTRTCPQLPLFGTIRPRGGPQAEGLHSDLQLCAERASTLTAWGVRGTRPGVHSISPAFHVDASPTSSATERDHDRKAAVTANPQGPCRRGRHCSPGRWRCQSPQRALASHPALPASGAQVPAARRARPGCACPQECVGRSRIPVVSWPRVTAREARHLQPSWNVLPAPTNCSLSVLGCVACARPGGAPHLAGRWGAEETMLTVQVPRHSKLVPVTT